MGVVVIVRVGVGVRRVLGSRMTAEIEVCGSREAEVCGSREAEVCGDYAKEELDVRPDCCYAVHPWVLLVDGGIGRGEGEGKGTGDIGGLDSEGAARTMPKPVALV